MEKDRTVQIFLSQNMSPMRVYEVIYTGNKTFTCNCDAFTIRSRCNHTRFVEKKVKDNNGTYPLEISPGVTAEDVKKASESSEAFRMFLIKHGKIEVL